MTTRTKDRKKSIDREKTDNLPTKIAPVVQQPYLGFNAIALLGVSGGIVLTLAASGLPGIVSAVMDGEKGALNLVLNLTTALTCGSLSLALLAQMSKNASREQDIDASQKRSRNQLVFLNDAIKQLQNQIGSLSDRIELEFETNEMGTHRCENTPKLWGGLEPGSKLSSFGASGDKDIELAPNSCGEQCIIGYTDRLATQLPRYMGRTKLGEINYIYVSPSAAANGKIRLSRAMMRKLCQYRAIMHVAEQNGLADHLDFSMVRFFICEGDVGPSQASFVGVRCPNKADNAPIPFAYRYQVPIITERELILHDRRVEVTFDPIEVTRRSNELEAYMSMACRRVSLTEALEMFGPMLPQVGNFDAKLSAAKIIELGGDAAEISVETTIEEYNMVEDFGDGSFQIYR
ncbi:MAG: hypothetical protein AAGB15_00115 [Pseudomonadota bacterium]